MAVIDGAEDIMGWEKDEAGKKGRMPGELRKRLMKFGRCFANVDVIELVQCAPTRQNKIEVRGRWGGK